MQSNLKYNIKRMARLATAIFLFMFLTAGGTETIAKTRTNNHNSQVSKNSFKNPDFAFPQDVIKNAEKEYDLALNNKDWSRVLEATMQLCTAENSINSEAANSCLVLIERAAMTVPQPYRSLARLMQASVLSHVYESSSWTYDGRNLPSDQRPESVSLWDKRMFADSIVNLIKATKPGLEYGFESIVKYPGIIKINGKKSLSEPFTLADFIYCKSLECLRAFADAPEGNLIPFGIAGEKNYANQNVSSAWLLKEEIKKNWLKRLNPDTPSQIVYCILEQCSEYGRRDPESNNSGFWKEWADYYKDKDAITAVLTLWTQNCDMFKRYPVSASNVITAEEFYSLIRDGLKRFPRSLYAPNLQDAFSGICRPQVEVSIQREYLPGSEVKVKISNSNQPEFQLSVFKLPDSYRDTNVTIGMACTKGAKVASLPFKISDEVPFERDTIVSLGTFPLGLYAVIPTPPASLSSLDENSKRNDARTFVVSGLSMISQRILDEDMRVYVVDGKDSSPIQGADVEAYEWISYSQRKNGNSDRVTIKSVSDPEGSVVIPKTVNHIEKFKLTKGDDSLTVDQNLYPVKSSETKAVRGSILLDRSIAKPGQEIGFEVIVCSQDGNEFRVLKDEPLEIIVRNASYVTVDTLVVKTNEHGNANAVYRLPENGMLGSWNFEIQRKIGKSRYEQIGTSSLKVEEYKTPTFHVKAEAQKPGSSESSDEIKIKGYALTYSGMPVSDASVDLNIKYRPWNPWRWGGMSASFATKSKTGADGSFEITLKTDSLKRTRFENAPFNFDVSVSSPAGETQTASGYFTIGNGFIISPSVKDKIELKGDSLTFNIPVYDMLGHPVKKQVNYTVYKSDSEGNRKEGESPILQGTFESPVLELPVMSLSPAAYRFEFSMPGEPDVRPAHATAILWSADEKVPPVESALWVPVTAIKAPSGAEKISFKYGSSYPDQKILCVVSNTKQEISRKWLSPAGKIMEVEVPAPGENDPVFVELMTIRNLKGSSEKIIITPASAEERMKIETVTFRDHLTAGNKEKWEFRFTKEDTGIAGISGVAVMTDKALNSLVPFEWRFDPRSAISYCSASSLRSYSAGARTLYFNYDTSKYLKGFYYSLPEWKYGFETGFQGFYCEAVYEECEMTDCAAPASMNLSVSRSAKLASASQSSAKMESVEAEDYADGGNGLVAEESPLAGSSEGGDSAVNNSPDVELRQSECPVAFFLPNIIGDENGAVKVEFEVPNFNTTWQFQLLGYSEDMETATIKLDAVSAKPVMVSMNSPRFVRTSDRIILSATAFNNTDKTLALGGRIEVIDAMTGKLLAVKDFKGVNTEPSGSRLLEMKYEVPGNVQLLALRAYALSKGASDGEQIPVMVLPSSSPVVESTPIYIGADTDHFTMKMPKFDGDASVTLTYCDNPLWYCLTALPDLTEDSGISSLSVMHALYGNSIGLGLLTRNPSLKAGLEEMLKADAKRETSILDSPLQNNAALKIAELGNTPWVNNAESETLRMHSLGNLLNKEEGENVVAGLVTKLMTYKRYDGGFAWCPDGDSSDWATGQILLYNAMLGRFGYMPENPAYRKALTDALGYAETEKLKYIRQSKNSNSAIEGMRNLLYIRSNYATAGMLPKESSEFHKMADKCIGLVKANWRNYDIYDKATVATLLQREGEKEVAAEILKSLGQFATRSESKGMWFDTLAGGIFSPWNKLITTVQVLEAYMDINPKSEDVDRLRQWLLLQRQAEDWSGMAYGAELIQGILNSGSDWTVSITTPDITIDGKSLIDSGSFPKYGEAVINLDPKKVSSKELIINRAGTSPAWGGIISQYVAPIKDINSVSTEDVKITKDVYLLREENGNMVPMAISGDVTPHKGDLVRVLLTVETTRDMEYVVIKDERAACLEPVDALSGRDVIDGIWLYKEVRNTETNMFVPFLRSGKFQMSYDCRLSQEGDFTAGIATLQSQYAPTLTAHSAGKFLRVK